MLMATEPPGKQAIGSYRYGLTHNRLSIFDGYVVQSCSGIGIKLVALIYALKIGVVGDEANIAHRHVGCRVQKGRAKVHASDSRIIR